MFILNAQRSKDCLAAFRRYAKYLESVQDKFPNSAYQLGTADWYFDSGNPKCPHDGHLVSVTIAEQPLNGRNRTISIRTVLQGAHNGSRMEFFYPRVFQYRFDFTGTHPSHSDWRYDEFRLSERGNVLHEIEWCHASDTARWIIEASDVHLVCEPAGA